jgi:hypothetical protein
MEFSNNLWWLGTEYSRNRVVVPAIQATLAGGIDSLESVFGLLNGLKIRARSATANQDPDCSLHEHDNYPLMDRSPPLTPGTQAAGNLFL